MVLLVTAFQGTSLKRADVTEINWLGRLAVLLSVRVYRCVGLNCCQSVFTGVGLNCCQSVFTGVLD